MSQKDSIKELRDMGYSPFLDGMSPCGETPEEAYKDRTTVFANAPRALMMVQFQASVDVMLQLKELNLLKEVV